MINCVSGEHKAIAGYGGDTDEMGCEWSFTQDKRGWHTIWYPWQWIKCYNAYAN